MRALLVVLFAVGLAFVPVARAATVERLSLEELADRAESVFRGSCVAVERQTIGGQAYQLFRFQVSETLKGKPEAVVEFHVPGGPAAGLVATYAGMPRFVVGEDAVVFLSGLDGTDYAWPLGLGQGHFRIFRLAASGQEHVQQMLEGLSPETSGAPKAAAGGNGSARVPLSDFLAAVRGLVSAPAPKARPQ
jgi:hypothetical protein